MSYQVDKFNGTFLTAVEDGTIDTTTDIRLVGKNYAGYGEVQNENFIHMLENFANTTAPPRAITGQLWYDSSSSEKKLKFYDGTTWKTANGAEVSISAPSGLSKGEFWWDETAKQLYTWSGAEFVLVGPELSPELGSTGVTVRTVKEDITNQDKTILQLTANDIPVAIVSSDTFTLSTTPGLYEDLSTFTVINKGITLANSNADGVSSSDYRFRGTATNALLLNGIAADEFLRAGALIFDSEISFSKSGLRVGVIESSDNVGNLHIYAEQYQTGLINNPTAERTVFDSVKDEDIIIRFTDNQTLVSTDLLQLTSETIVPARHNVIDIGKDDPQTPINNRYIRNIYATNFIGALTGTVTGNVEGNVEGNIVNSTGTVIVNASENSIGNITTTYSGVFNGNVVGELQGNATNAIRLNDFEASEQIPSTSNKQSVPLRSATGNLFATQFVGQATLANRLKIDNSASDTDPNYRSAKTTATANTIVARDSSSDIYANVFNGTATAARYADLAEKYLTDEDYEAGTVVAVGGTAEVTACSKGSHVIGVVSTNPAYMMNKDLEGGTYIALKGRVPVKVGGKVQKGDTLVAGQNGYAIPGSEGHIFGVALESNDDESVKLIESVVL